MASIDLNLLAALDVLLAERSVTGAAKRLGLSTSATSRALSRLRIATGDPLLVQAGRSLVPTPYAEQLASRVHVLASEVTAVLKPAMGDIDPKCLQRTFTIRANEGFVALFATALITGITAVAPYVRLRFVPKPDKEAATLRDGTIDLEIGATAPAAPELRRQLIFRDRFIGAVRTHHPLLAEPVTPQCYVGYGHVIASRRGKWHGPIDDALDQLDLRRDVVAIVPGFLEALDIARRSDLIALAPRSCLLGSEMIARGLQPFDLPVATPEIAVSVMWHPRLDADPGHRWLRQTLIEICQSETRTQS